jgi:SnoaL-like domain
MSATVTVKTLITALQARDMAFASDSMADDFIVSGFTHMPLNKTEFLAVQSELCAAMPDFSYNFSHDQHQHDEVQALIQITGTQTNDLNLPMFGIPVISATGLAIVLPQVHVAFRVEDKKVTEMRMETVAGSGLAGLLQQVGSELPVLPRLGNQDITRLNESGDTAI